MFCIEKISDSYYPFGMKQSAMSYLSGSSEQRNFFLYNGKELQTDFDIDWYDYGARFYDPQLGRWHVPDPMAEEYQNMSPYSYCNGNPINSFDVNGEWIYIMHEGKNYKYDNGTLYQYQTEGDRAGDYTEYTVEEGSFLAGVKTGLDNLASKTEVGQGLINYFANDDNNAYIKQNDKNVNSINMAGSSNTIYLSPNLEGSDIPTEKGVQKSEFWLDIGHELSHRQDILKRGNEATKEWLKNPTTGESIAESEKYATHIENRMREAAGMPLRTHYSVQGTRGWEPSRIIDRKGNSLYYQGVNYIPLKLRKKQKK